MSKTQIVEPWHPDLVSKEFLNNLFSGRAKYEARRYVEKNPKEVRGVPATFHEGDWVYEKSKPAVHGVILETYLTERWVNREREGGTPSLRSRPYQYELSCLVKWVPKSRPKDSQPETVIVSAAGLKSLTDQIKTLENKLKRYTVNGTMLAKYYEEHKKQDSTISQYATVTTEG